MEGWFSGITMVSTTPQWQLEKLELLPCPLTSSGGVPFSSSRYLFTTASGSVGVAAQGERWEKESRSSQTRREIQQGRAG